LPVGEAPLDRGVAEVRVRQIHDRPSQVGTRRIGVPQVHEPPGQAGEGLLGEVLGQRTIAGQQVPEPRDRVGVLNVQLIQPIHALFLDRPVVGSYVWNVHTVWTPHRAEWFSADRFPAWPRERIRRISGARTGQGEAATTLESPELTRRPTKISPAPRAAPASMESGRNQLIVKAPVDGHGFRAVVGASGSADGKVSAGCNP